MKSFGKSLVFFIIFTNHANASLSCFACSNGSPVNQGSGLFLSPSHQPCISFPYICQDSDLYCVSGLIMRHFEPNYTLSGCYKSGDILQLSNIKSLDFKKNCVKLSNELIIWNKTQPGHLHMCVCSTDYCNGRTLAIGPEILQDFNEVERITPPKLRHQHKNAKKRDKIHKSLKGKGGVTTFAPTYVYIVSPTSFNWSTSDIFVSAENVCCKLILDSSLIFLLSVLTLNNFL